jgi:DNA processing protein
MEGHMALTERQALMVLSALPDFGPITVRRALQSFGARAADLFTFEERALSEVLGPKRARSLVEWPKHFDLEAEFEKMAKLGVDYLIPSDEAYPRHLRKLPDAPLGLYRRGTRVIEGPAIAVVGTRQPTPYGRKVTAQLVGGLVRAGFTIVSGMALGIDTEAHHVALDHNGATIAVLGNGVDRIYPAANRKLYERLTLEGAILSEFYLGRVADRQTFPQRNRIVSGMCDATLVIESAARGGSLITARFAMEQNRTVFAVPGRIDQPHSRGCLDLIRDGASLVTSVGDILEELRFMQLDLPLAEASGVGGNSAPEAEDLSSLGPEERQIFTQLVPGESFHMDQLCDLSGLSSFQVQAALMMLELQRRIVRTPDGRYERN